jgi:hypothetical protein
MLSDKATRLKRDVVLEWFGDRAAFIEFHEDLPGFGNLAGLRNYSFGKNLPVLCI